MSWTKRQFVDQAFEEIGLAPYVFDLTPEQREGALRRLDAMMGEWEAAGIDIDWPHPATPEASSLDTDSLAPAAANPAIYYALALRIAPTVGKTCPPELFKAAKAAYDALLVYILRVLPTRKMDDCIPAGSGNRSWRYGTIYLPPE